MLAFGQFIITLTDCRLSNGRIKSREPRDNAIKVLSFFYIERRTHRSESTHRRIQLGKPDHNPIKQACTTYDPRKLFIWPAKPKISYIQAVCLKKLTLNGCKYIDFGPWICSKKIVKPAWDLSCASLLLTNTKIFCDFKILG